MHEENPTSRTIKAYIYAFVLIIIKASQRKQVRRNWRIKALLYMKYTCHNAIETTSECIIYVLYLLISSMLHDIVLMVM